MNKHLSMVYNGQREEEKNNNMSYKATAKHINLASMKYKQKNNV